MSTCFLIARDADGNRNIVASASTVEQLWEVVSEMDVVDTAKDVGLRLSIMVVDTDASVVTEEAVESEPETDTEGKEEEEEDDEVEIDMEDLEKKLSHGNATFACESVPETSAMIDALESLGVPLEAMTIDVRVTAGAGAEPDADSVYARGLTHIQKRITDALKIRKTVRISRPVLVPEDDPNIKTVTSSVFSRRTDAPAKAPPPTAVADDNDNVPVHVERADSIRSDAAESGGTTPP